MCSASIRASARWRPSRLIVHPTPGYQHLRLILTIVGTTSQRPNVTAADSVGKRGPPVHRALDPRAVPVSAPPRVAEHLRSAPDGPVAVLHHTPSALYVEVAGRCVGVVAPGAAQVPCALRLTGRVADAVLAAGPSTPYVERGTLYLTGNPLRVGRFVDVRVPRIDPGRVLVGRRARRNAVARPPRPAAGDNGLAAHLCRPGRASAAPALPRPAATTTGSPSTSVGRAAPARHRLSRDRPQTTTGSPPTSRPSVPCRLRSTPRSCTCSSATAAA